MTERTIPTTGYLPALDGLRAVAAFTVVAYHAGLPFPGGLGVTAFFALSGFLITRLLLVEHDRTGTVSLRSFYARRSLRIFPAYYTFVLASIAADRVLGDPWTQGQITTALTYTANYYQACNDHSGPQAHIWSLAVEEQFYLLWPALFLALQSRRVLGRGIAALLVAVVAWRTWLYVGVGVPSTYVYNAFDTRFDGLLVGCGVAVLTRSPRGQAWFARLSTHAALPVLAIAGLLTLRAQWSAPVRHGFGYTVDALVCALVIVQLVRLHQHAAWRWLEHPVTRWLGAISYPVYLWHIWALTAAGRVVEHPAAVMALGSAVVIGVAAGSYYVVERPFLALKHRLTHRAPSTPASARRPTPPSRASASG